MCHKNNMTISSSEQPKNGNLLFKTTYGYNLLIALIIPAYYGIDGYRYLPIINSVNTNYMIL